MTKRLERAFEEASKLPRDEQDALAQWILAELSSERRWRRLLDRSKDELAELANEALTDYRDGGTEELDPEKL